MVISFGDVVDLGLDWPALHCSRWVGGLDKATLLSRARRSNDAFLRSSPKATLSDDVKWRLATGPCKSKGGFWVTQVAANQAAVVSPKDYTLYLSKMRPHSDRINGCVFAV